MTLTVVCGRLSSMIATFAEIALATIVGGLVVVNGLLTHYVFKVAAAGGLKQYTELRQGYDEAQRALEAVNKAREDLRRESDRQGNGERVAFDPRET